MHNSHNDKNDNVTRHQKRRLQGCGAGEWVHAAAHKFNRKAHYMICQKNFEWAKSLFSLLAVTCTYWLFGHLLHPLFIVV